MLGNCGYQRYGIQKHGFKGYDFKSSTITGKKGLVQSLSMQI